jgi:hypothetical protein
VRGAPAVDGMAATLAESTVARRGRDATTREDHITES